MVKILRELGSKWSIYQKRGLWHLFAPRGTGHPVPYYDGQIIDENDEPTNQGSNVHAEKRRLQKLLNKYIRKLRKTCKASGTPKPEAGDCFYCQMVRDDNGRPLANDDCLRSHLEETYVHGSLILNAIRSRGRRCPEAVWNMHDIVCQDVRAYFKRELGI
jgi:hypothetical protein